MGDVDLSPEAAAVANRIQAVDRKLDDLEHKVEAYIAQGLRFGGALNIKQRAEDDAERDRLLLQRAELVTRLKGLTSKS